MIRLSTLLWLALVAGVSFAMFEVKYEVMDLEDQLAKVNRNIVADQDAIHVLKAEWSYLSQPSRLDELSKRFLTLGPIATAQLGQIDNIPMRPSAAPPALAESSTPSTLPAANRLGPSVAPAGAVKPGPTRLANARLRIDR